MDFNSELSALCSKAMKEARGDREARRLGWGTGSMPPMWVWGAIANDIIARKPVDPPVLH